MGGRAGRRAGGDALPSPLRDCLLCPSLPPCPPAAHLLHSLHPSGCLQVCESILTVTGGVLLAETDGDNECPAGSYYDAEEACVACPVGYTCPGGAPEEAKIIPCPDSESSQAAAGNMAACRACFVWSCAPIRASP